MGAGGEGASTTNFSIQGSAMARKPSGSRKPPAGSDTDWEANPEREVGIAKIGQRRYLVDFTSGQLDAKLEGEAWHRPLDGIITVDSTLRGKEFVDCLIHECLHGYLDETGLLTRDAHRRREAIITELATQITEVIFTKEAMRRAGF